MLSKIIPNLRMAAGLTLLTFATLLGASLLGLFPDARALKLRAKTTLAESLAISCSLMAQRNDYQGLRENLRATKERNTSVLSAALRNKEGKLVVRVGNHDSFWHLRANDAAAHDNIFLPIIDASGSEWGQVEVAFAPDSRKGLLGLIESPFARFALFVVPACLFSYVFYLQRILSVLNPSNAVPQRVRAALDTLAEGLVILDTEQRITMANQAFEKKVGQTTQQLVGKKIGEIRGISEKISTCILPAQRGLPAKGTMVRYRDHEADEEHMFLVNATPIKGDEGDCRGVLATFEDITELESQKRDLQSMLMRLTKSREHIQQQNVELMRLATTDSLTGCLNRRTFFEQYQAMWRQARASKTQLHCAMVDIDYFKSINDNHGHSAGDEVLRQVAATLRRMFGEPHLVCRYGGEEFCVLIKTQTSQEAYELAERTRLALEALVFEDLPLKVTASLGVSSTEFGATDTQEMLDQADKCLYVAKRGGRNQVVRWDNVPDDCEVDESKLSRTKLDDAADESIPFSAVACLLSALAYRDADTAAHSRRVADLIFALARERMPLKDSYVVEIAALLHDIGKIGVPDNILLKPGKLTKEEWEIMCLHDRIGVEIVAAAFANQDLVDVIRCHHAKYDGAGEEELPRGEEIPLGARILAVADAYDAMVSDRVYRKGMPVADALAELKRCAGTHFDPEVVDAFTKMIGGYNPFSMDTSSKQAAIQLGLQVENLTGAMDQKDVEGIRAIATHLAQTAAKHNLPDVQQIAEDIEAMAKEDPDMVALVDSALNLVDLCRATRTSYTDVIDTRASVRPPAPTES